MDCICEERLRFKESVKEKTILLSNRKRVVKFLCDTIRKIGLENLTLIRNNEVLKSRWKQIVSYQTNMCKWMAEQMTAEE